MTLQARLAVTGRVQGVGYRDWVMEMAERLGLSGWVRNRVDGSVEMLLAGAPDQITAMIERCRKGPPLSKVEAIEVEGAAMLDLGLRRPGEAFSLIATK